MMITGNAAKRYLVLNDIHSNEVALRAVLDDASHHGPYDGKLCAGDVVGYGPNPNECIEIVSNEGFVTVLGNHDRIVRSDEADDFGKFVYVPAVINREMLSVESRRYLEGLSSKPYVDPEGKFAVVHGSFEGEENAELAGFEDIHIVRERDAIEAMKYLKFPLPHSKTPIDVILGIFGHEHVPIHAVGYIDEDARTRHIRVENLRFWKRPSQTMESGAMEYVVSLKGTKRVPKPTFKVKPDLVNVAFPLTLNNVPSEEGNWKPKALFNPGSVGQPRHGSPAACYGIVEFMPNGGITLNFMNAEYDVAETQRRMQEKNFSEFLVERLEFGL